MLLIFFFYEIFYDFIFPVHELAERLMLTYTPEEDIAKDTNSSVDEAKSYIIFLLYDLSKFCPYNTVLVDPGDPSINAGEWNLLMLYFRNLNKIGDVFCSLDPPEFKYFCIFIAGLTVQPINLAPHWLILSYALHDGWLLNIPLDLRTITAIA